MYIEGRNVADVPRSVPRAASVGHLITDRFSLGRREMSRACVRARARSTRRIRRPRGNDEMTGGMLTFLRVLAGTRSPAHGVADHEDDPAGDQRGEQHHQAGHARALQHVCRTRRVLHLRPRADGQTQPALVASTAHASWHTTRHTPPRTRCARRRRARERARARALVSRRESRGKARDRGGYAALRDTATAKRRAKLEGGCACVRIVSPGVRQSHTRTYVPYVRVRAPGALDRAFRKTTLRERRPTAECTFHRSPNCRAGRAKVLRARGHVSTGRGVDATPACESRSFLAGVTRLADYNISRTATILPSLFARPPA